MSRRQAFGWLWGGACLWLPLPILAPTQGAVPVIRFVWLGAVSGTYAALVDGSGVAWAMVGLLLGHALLYAAALAAIAAGVVRLLPPRVRTPAVAVAITGALLCALFLDLYHTPFDDDAARTGWLGLFP